MHMVCLLGLAAAAVGQQPLLDRLREQAGRHPVTVAHRGDSENLPENSLVAFRGALQAGAPVIEFDVRQTRDGVWVVLHDATLDRTTDAVGKLGGAELAVADLDRAQLEGLDAGKWKGPEFTGEPLPTLEQALAVILPEAVPMIERKAGSAQSLVELLRRLDVIDRVLVQAFDWPWLRQLHELEPRLSLGALSDRPLTETVLAELTRTGARLAHWDHRRLRVDDCAALQHRGLLVCVYTVDADSALLGAAALGCDLITTNRPRRLQELIERRRLLRPQR